MASIHHEIQIGRPASDIWDAVSAVGELHSRLVPGFVVDTVLDAGTEPQVRIVTFASGVVLRERIITVDATNRRLVWSIEADFVGYHNGALQVMAVDANSSRVTWIADVYPPALADQFSPLMRSGLETMKRHIETN